MPHPARHWWDQHPRRHADQSNEQPLGVDPYPYIFSKDPFDPRRFGPFGRVAAPSRRRLPNAAVWFSWATVVVLIGGGLLVVGLGLFGR